MLEGFGKVSGFGQCWHLSHLADKKKWPNDFPQTTISLHPF